MELSNILNDLGLKFSKPKIVMTRAGERQVRSAKINNSFWDLWKSNKDEVKKLGFSVGKNLDNEWEITLWAQTMTREERAAASAASHAVDADIAIPIPAGLELMPFQRGGIAYALNRPGTLIGDEMGLGKTIQAIGFANTIKAQRILVVAPASLLVNWRNEINRWQTLGLPVTIIRAGQTTFKTAPGWYVINYDIVSRYDEELKRCVWDLAVFDECQYMKSRTAKRTVALLGGGKAENKREPIRATRTLALTGTPIMNRPAELYPILHHLDAKRWGSFSTFGRRYCGGWENNNQGASNLEELNARLRETVMVRRLKADVLTELPAKVRQIVTLDLDADTAKVVARENETFERTEAAIAAAAADVARAELEGDEAAYNEAVKKLRNMQGIGFTEMAKVRHETALAKLPAVIEHLKATEGKILVFAWHTDVIDSLCHELADQGVVKITGETPKEKRQDIVDRFQKDEGVRFFVGNIKAAGVGLTLTASCHVVFGEIDWTPSSISQAEDRAHRIGQKESVLVQHLVLDGSLDAKMAKFIVSKQRVIDAALDAKTTVDLCGKEQPIVSEHEVEAPQAAAPVNFNAKKAALAELAAKLTEDQIEAIHQALRTVAAMDTDRASSLNGVGFSKMDTGFGCDLAGKESLSPKQAAAGMRLARKYRRQYSEGLYARIFLETDGAMI